MTQATGSHGRTGEDGLDAEDLKLITLARSARARNGAAEGAAVRDGDGRTYVATTVSLPSLGLTALQLAVAMAVSSGAPALEAGAIVTDSTEPDALGTAAVRDLAPGAAVLLARTDGTLAGVV